MPSDLSQTGMTVQETAPPREEKVGLSFWMDRVTRECARARDEFPPEAVHDLRVALRRCRSIADGFMALDYHGAWKDMKLAGKTLFRSLGDLRDVQVMMEWTRRFAIGQDEASLLLLQHLSAQESRLKDDAGKALESFSRKRWATWSKLLSKRAGQVPLEGAVFQHMALECWQRAHELHREALRNRSQAAFHRLRIGIKRFRYTVENFLPKRHEAWGNDLRELQDALGEMHDLDILWRTAVSIGALKNDQARFLWRTKIDEERRIRLSTYRQRMLGKTSLWQVWRADLPSGCRFREAAVARIQSWASFRDPNPVHSLHVGRLALQIYDGLKKEGLLEADDTGEARSILDLAAILHRIGLAAERKRYHKATYRMIRNLNPPLGWAKEILVQAALVARYHRGALPNSAHKRLARIPEELRPRIILQAGILRLAAAFDFHHDQSIGSIEVRRVGDAVIIYAAGYREDSALARKLAGARYLLEVSIKAPVILRALPPYPP